MELATAAPRITHEPTRGQSDRKFVDWMQEVAHGNDRNRPEKLFSDAAC